MPTFKTDSQIITAMEAYIQAQAATADLAFDDGSPEKAIVKMSAYGLLMIYTITYIFYQNIWAHLADRVGLSEWYQVFGLTWVGEALDEARAQILAKFRERALGTPGWFEATVVNQFAEVTEATYVNVGVNIALLAVFHNGGDVDDTTVTNIQTYFDNPNRKVVTLDLRVVTYNNFEATLDELSALSA